MRLGIVGCGDVFHRYYLPAVAALGGRASVTGLCDRDTGRADHALSVCAPRWPGARVYADSSVLFEQAEIDAVINLTPAPLHGEVSAAALAAGLHVYSEKPIAGSVVEAEELRRVARLRRRLLLCAPAIMASKRLQWLGELVRSGRLGSPTLATGHIGNLGPAAWRGYTGDASVHYSARVGPLLDQGVYILHAITGLLGPAKRVQALGGISVPARRSLSGTSAGDVIEVHANDHTMVHLDFGNALYAQVLASFAVPATKVPALELHGTTGSISLADVQSARGTVDVFFCDKTHLGVEGWITDIEPPGDNTRGGHVAALGPAHFIACLRGDEKPVLTAGHARHVLEIALAAEKSIEEGVVVDLVTDFRASDTRFSPIDSNVNVSDADRVTAADAGAQ